MHTHTSHRHGHKEEPLLKLGTRETLGRHFTALSSHAQKGNTILRAVSCGWQNWKGPSRKVPATQMCAATAVARVGSRGRSGLCLGAGTLGSGGDGRAGTVGGLGGPETPNKRTSPAKHPYLSGHTETQTKIKITVKLLQYEPLCFAQPGGLKYPRLSPCKRGRRFRVCVPETAGRPAGRRKVGLDPPGRGPRVVRDVSVGTRVSEEVSGRDSSVANDVRYFPLWERDEARSRPLGGRPPPKNEGRRARESPAACGTGAPEAGG